jgi:ADP-ribosyl-[dinitrogen reductase] hydrolase
MHANRSVVSPLRIDAVAVPGTGGLIGMTGCPGKDEYAGIGIASGPWKRDLDDDLEVIIAWGAQALVSLIEDYEFVLLDVPEFPEKVRALGIPWFHLPVVDLDVPDKRFDEMWETAGKELRRILADGGKIVLHCRAGLGRTGTIAARLLIEFGMDPREAVAKVRQSRPGAIQTRAQEEYVLIFTVS